MLELIREIRANPLARFSYDARPANGSNAIFRACLIANDKRRWCGVQTPVSRRGDDLAALGHELRQQAHVFVVDGFNFLHAELANFLAAEIFASALASAASSRAAGTRRTTLAVASAERWTIAATKADRRRTGDAGRSELPPVLLLL